MEVHSITMIIIQFFPSLFSFLFLLLNYLTLANLQASDNTADKNSFRIPLIKEFTLTAPPFKSLRNREIKLPLKIYLNSFFFLKSAIKSVAPFMGTRLSAPGITEERFFTLLKNFFSILFNARNETIWRMRFKMAIDVTGKAIQENIQFIALPEIESFFFFSQRNFFFSLFYY